MVNGKKSPRRFVFLDRDGVINVDPNDYTTTIEQWIWAEGALEGIQKLTEAGFGIVIITNQACIAKGLQSEEGLEKLHRYMLDGIDRAGGSIIGIYHCPHKTGDGCSCRKPEPGMLFKAAEDFSIPLSETFMIGDSLTDMEAGKRAGTRTILIDSDSNEKKVTDDTNLTEKEKKKRNSDGMATQSEPSDFRATNLLEAANIVIRETPACINNHMGKPNEK